MLFLIIMQDGHRYLVFCCKDFKNSLFCPSQARVPALVNRDLETGKKGVVFSHFTEFYFPFLIIRSTT